MMRLDAVSPAFDASELSERTKFVMARFRRRVAREKYRRHIDDLLSIAVTVALQSMHEGRSVEWACKQAMRAFWPDIAYEKRRNGFEDYEPHVAFRKHYRPIPARSFAKCSTMQEIVLRHRFESDMGDAAIARAINANAGTVWTHTKRGLKNVRRAIA